MGMSNDIEREAFEERNPVPDDATYNAHRDGYYWVNHPNVNHPFNNDWMTWQEAVAWQAARANSVGAVPERPAYSVDRHFLVELIAERQKRIDDLELQLKQITAAPTAPAVEGGGVPDTTFNYLLAHLNEISRVEENDRDLALEEHLDRALKALAATHPHNGEQGEWVRCDDRLPTEADADCFKQVWVYNDVQKRAHYCEYWAIKAFGYHWWMPTGVKRPAPPTEREDDHE